MDAVLKCGDCPVFGASGGAGRCFCSGRPTTDVNAADDCKYGIRDYRAYWAAMADASERIFKVNKRGTDGGFETESIKTGSDG